MSTPLPTRLGRYEILGPLGAGGMGEVYRARDSRLGRDVAIKVLPADLARDPQRLARIEREARIVAALNHPNIVTLHSLEDEDGVRFLTMELVEGGTLAIPAAGLPAARVVAIGAAIADALAAAHEKGVVHRDLKPANVMITRDDHVKVLDFGIARQEASATDRTITMTSDRGSGTAPYMAPEQIRGAPTDARTDLFALGVLLYELASGRLPFEGATAADVASAILRDPPRPLPAGVPPALANIIGRCLEKNPDDRFQGAKDLRNELRTLGRALDTGTVRLAAAPGPRRWIPIAAGVAGLVLVIAIGFGLTRGRKPSPPMDNSNTIAVLPFENMSSDPEQEYFSDGLSEELLNLLTRIPELKVTARTSSFAFKGKPDKAPEIGRQLHVAHLLEGSVRKAGNRVRVTAQLVRASDGVQTWSNVYDRSLEDVFAIQEEIARDVVSELRIRLVGRAPKVRATNSEAYALYLRGLELSKRKTIADNVASDSLFKRVLAIDSTYAPAWVGLAGNAMRSYGMGAEPGVSAVTRARAAAENALACDPDYGPAHSWMATILHYENDLAGAARHLELALALAPNEPDVISSVAELQFALGHLDEMVAINEHLVRQDPLSPSAYNELGHTYYFARRYDDAITSFRNGLALSPDFPGGHAMIALALLRKGDAPAAGKEIRQESNENWRLSVHPMVEAALGHRAASDALLDSLHAKYGHDTAYFTAMTYAFRNEPDAAFAWLDKAIAYEDPALTEVHIQAMFDPIRSDPRWLSFLRKTGKAPDQLAAIRFSYTLPAATTP